jgi:biotin-[acetyl-CoA-carboxylase] ligase BirA-like protein
VNGGPWFDFSSCKSDQETILGWYLLPQINASPIQQPAIVESKIGKGVALLFGPHLEFDPTVMAVSSISEESISDRVHILSILPPLLSSNNIRLNLLDRLFTRLGLMVNKPDQQRKRHFKPDNNGVVEISPMILCSAPESVSAIPSILKALKPKLNPVMDGNNTVSILSDCVNEFALIEQDYPSGDESNQLEARLRQQSLLSDKSPTIFIYHSISPQSQPSFNITKYFASLPASQSFGSTVLYGEETLSTQTLIEKNYALQCALPDGLVCITSNQQSGRGLSRFFNVLAGRGGNHWISQQGCLMFSLIVRYPASNANVVFIQYLAGLAMADAIDAVLGVQGAVRLKWPNDIYASDGGTHRESYKKIGGVLVSSSMHNGKFTLVIGVGVNISNTSPTLCVNDVAGRMGVRGTCRETVLAKFMDVFAQMYGVFTRTGFTSFQDGYYRAWLHMGQEVSVVEATGGKVDGLVIRGIDVRSGLLRATREGETYLLQPDGNSFDMFGGLIKRKI